MFAREAPLQFSEDAAQSQEFFVIALFFDHAVGQYDDLIGVANGRESVCDDQGRSTLHECV